jgi:uncharacterized protein (DUF433 family)
MTPRAASHPESRKDGVDAQNPLQSGMLNWADCSAVERFSEKVSGAWLFCGTRVPVRALFENLEDGATIDEFLEWFPGVTRAQVQMVLEFAGRSLAEA